MIRLIIALLFLFVFFIISLPLWLIGLILRFFNTSISVRFSSFFVKFASRILLLIAGVSLTIIGKEKIIKDENALFIGNHKGFFDIFVTYPYLPYNLGYMGKDNLKKLPLINVWMYLIGCVFVDRYDSRKAMKALIKAVELCKKNHSMFVFPEGTRNKNSSHTLLPFKGGAFKIATKNNLKVQPIVLLNTAKILEEHMPFLKKGNVTMIILDPVDISTFSKEELLHVEEYFYNLMSETIRKYESL